MHGTEYITIQGAARSRAKVHRSGVYGAEGCVLTWLCQVSLKKLILTCSRMSRMQADPKP